MTSSGDKDRGPQIGAAIGASAVVGLTGVSGPAGLLIGLVSEKFDHGPDRWKPSQEDLDTLAKHDLSEPDVAWNLAADAFHATADTLAAMVEETAANLTEIEVHGRRIDELNEDNRKGLEALLSGVGP
jgi:hypothetical protein